MTDSEAASSENEDATADASSETEAEQAEGLQDDTADQDTDDTEATEGKHSLSEEDQVDDEVNEESRADVGRPETTELDPDDTPAVLLTSGDEEPVDPDVADRAGDGEIRSDGEELDDVPTEEDSSADGDVVAADPVD